MYKKFIITIILFFLLGNSVLATTKPNINLDFFNNFHDENLTYYIKLAIENNHDLRKAKFKVNEYRERVKYTFGNELPMLSMGTDYLGVHVPKLDNFNLKSNAFILPFLVGYEPDLLLKNHDKTKSTKKLYEITELQEKILFISLVSDIASNYINLLQYKDLISLQDNILTLEKQELDLYEKLYTLGIISLDKFNNEKQTLNQEKITLSNLHRQKNIIQNDFSILVGLTPDRNSDLKLGKISKFEYSKNIPAEIESDRIFSRPDVISAQKQLEKAKIDIRISKKEFFPKFMLNGFWIFNTISSGTFFSWESSLASILLGSSQELFVGGKKIANLHIEKSKYEQLYEEYSQTDLKALKEVDTALFIIKFDTENEKNINDKFNLEENIHKNSELKYKQGIISNLDLLNEKQQLLKLQQTKTQSKTTRLIGYITLYKAVGGNL